MFVSVAITLFAATSVIGTPVSTLILNTEAGDGDVNRRLNNSSSKLIGYFNNILRPNVYIGIYYLIFAKEYGLLMNYNILISEDIYR